MPKRRNKRRTERSKPLPWLSRVRTLGPRASHGDAQLQHTPDTDVDALAAHSVGQVVSGVVTGFAGDGGLWLNVDGVFGGVGPDELLLADGEPAQDRYPIGDTIQDLFVWQINHDVRVLLLSVRRNTPSYVEALADHNAGEVVSGVVTGFPGNGGLWLDVDGVFGGVGPDELPLADGEPAQDRYPIGDTIHDLFVWQVNHDTRDLSLSVRHNAPGYVEALAAHSVGKVVSGVVTGFPSNGGLWLNVDSVVGVVPPRELSLADGQSAQDHYPIGDTIHDMFIRQVDHEQRVLVLSVRRNAPSYLEALAARSVGEVVSGVVTRFADDGSLWLDVDGVVGVVPPRNLPLADGQSAQDRYAVGDIVHDLFVWQVNHDVRVLVLSVRRNAPGYVEALAAHSVGEVVSGVVTQSNKWDIWLDVDGVIGNIWSDELALADGESAQDRYAVGDTISDLVVWQVDHDQRRLCLSARRNTPAYVAALAARSIGEAVSGVVTGFAGNGGLWLDVDDVIGGVPPWDLPLADGESVQDRYPIDAPVHDLFVWQVDHDARRLGLSARRNTPAYVAALAALSGGEVVDGVVTQSTEWGIWLDAAGVIGWIPASELALDEGESLRDRYAINDPVEAQVWLVDHLARDVILSVHRLELDSLDAPAARGATIEAVVRGTTPRGTRSPIRVLAADADVWILPHALSLSTAVPPPFNDGQVIRVVVIDLDEHGRPTELSHRRTLDRWDAEVERLTPGALVAQARILPQEAHPGAGDRLAVDLGAITGLITDTEIDREAAMRLMTFGANDLRPVVVESVDRDVGIATVSHAKFDARWRELAEAVSVGDQVQAELRRVSRSKAILDLGSGLLAEMPEEQIPSVTDTDEQRRAREGETFTVLITDKDEEKRLIVAENKNQWLADLIAKGENQTCEFKAVFKGPKPDRPNKDVEPYNGLPVLRAMAGLMNRNGGYVLIGVQDDAKNKSDVISWQRSGFTSEDKMMSALSDLASTKLTSNPPFNLSFEPLPNGDRILVVDCKAAKDPIYLQHGGKELFFIRWPAVTKEMDGSELVNYIQNNFPDRAAAG